MTQARKRMTLNQRQRAVFSKVCGQTWMGECAFWAWDLLLMLVKIWLRPCVHCQSSQNHNEVISHEV